MKRTPYELVSARTFRHPLVKGLAKPWIAHTAPLGVRASSGQSIFFREYEVRGDTCEQPLDLRALWATHSPATVWSLSTAVPREYGGHLCTVFGPQGFDIESYGTDIALLYMLEVMGEFAHCTGVAGEWGEIARYLAGTASWTQAAGWIHRDTGVVVVCSKMEGATLLEDELLALCGSDCRDVVGYMLKSDQKAVWKKAANILRRHIAR